MSESFKSFLIKYARKDFKLFSNLNDYRSFISQINRELKLERTSSKFISHLNSNKTLHNSILVKVMERIFPIRFFGNPDGNLEYAVVGINPGFNFSRYLLEALLLLGDNINYESITWEKYYCFLKNYFNHMAVTESDILYFKIFAKFLNKLNGKVDEKNYWEFLNDKVLALEFFPFRSKKNPLSTAKISKKNNKIINYYFNQLKDILNYLKVKKFILIHSNTLYTIFKKRMPNLTRNWIFQGEKHNEIKILLFKNIIGSKIIILNQFIVRPRKKLTIIIEKLRSLTNENLNDN